jgi:hypothetical protein
MIICDGEIKNPLPAGWHHRLHLCRQQRPGMDRSAEALLAGYGSRASIYEPERSSTNYARAPIA